MRLSSRLLFGAGLWAGILATTFNVKATVAAANGYTFTGLGDLPGDSFYISRAFGISGDGSTIVGQSGVEAFRWTRSSGMVSIGYGIAYGASHDGTVIVGQSGRDAFRWTDATGIVDLSDLSGGRLEGSAQDVSADGDTVVGRVDASVQYAFRWTTSGGVSNPDLSLGTNTFSEVRAVSGDGNAAAGICSWGGFYWTSSRGITMVGTSADDAWGISADGKTVVGSRSSGYSGNEQAFYWTPSGGMVFLGHLPGTVEWSRAFDVSADGSTIVGWAQSSLGGRAFIWDAVNGMQDLNQVLASAGIALSGWTLVTADGISDDGTVVTGYGINPSGDLEAYVVTIPEPSNFAFALCSLAGALVARKATRNR